MEQEEKIQQIDLEGILKEKASTIYAKLPKFVVGWMKKLIHQDDINDVIRRNHSSYGVDFAKALIKDFNVNVTVEGVENLPETSHLCTFASNHPLGGFDGVILGAVLGEHYPNVKLVVNDVLMNLVNLRPIFVPINKYGSQAKDSAKGIGEAYESDAQLVVFPAGLVSRKQGKVIRDLEWKKNFIAKTVQYQRDVVPVYFSGHNSKFFYRLANFRKKIGLPNIELTLLPSELFKHRNHSFTVKIGKIIPWQTFDKSKTPAQWAEYVKNMVYWLDEKGE